MKLIKNDLYLLLIDEEAEIKFNDLMYDSKLKIVMRYNSYNDGCYKIIAYYPLKEAKELDLPLLPNPFKVEVDVEKLACEKYNIKEGINDYDERYYNTINVAKAEAFIEGYNVAQAKQYSLEDMLDAFEFGLSKPEFQLTRKLKEDFTKFIQSLSTQQLPKEFVGWVGKKKCPYDFTSRCTIDRCDCELVFETITNSEGKEEIQGTYKY